MIAAMEIYTRIPVNFPITPLRLAPETTRQVVLIFHGSRDGGNPVFEEIANRFRELALLTPGTEVVNYRWDEGADQRLRAAASARRLGRALGIELAGLPQLQQLRLIAHSSGAFVLDALCESFREQRGDAWVEMTLLDPFGISGFVDWGYGARRHGHCADFAVAFVNTDDSAVATNWMLRQAYNHTVTHSPKRADPARGGHYWPPRYYLDFIDLAEATPGIRTHDDYPRGAVRDPWQ